MQSRIKEEDDLCGHMDFSLFEATLASLQTKSLIPILKEELKLKIQANRLASGKEELPKPVFKEPEKFELTEEEKQKKEVRKERNRIAAAKCRNRRKSQHESLKTTLAEMELKNFTLKRRIEDLEKEKLIVLKDLKEVGQFRHIFLPTSQHSPQTFSTVDNPYTTECKVDNSPIVVVNDCIGLLPDEKCPDRSSTAHNGVIMANTEFKSGSFDDSPMDMEFMNWLPPRCPEPRPCSSTCTMDESWQDGFFDEVDGDLFDFESQPKADKSKSDKIGDICETQEAPRYFLPLIPVFDDDATVPGNVEGTTFHGRDTPTSPTFY